VSNGPRDDRDARGVDIEVWENRDGEPVLGVIYPNRIKINGVEVLTPESDSILKLRDFSRKTPVIATVEMFVRSLTIHADTTPMPMSD
jgi:hypothetical protein